MNHKWFTRRRLEFKKGAQRQELNGQRRHATVSLELRFTFRHYSITRIKEEIGYYGKYFISKARAAKQVFLRAPRLLLPSSPNT
jgi:hypothetical protein